MDRQMVRAVNSAIGVHAQGDTQGFEHTFGGNQLVRHNASVAPVTRRVYANGAFTPQLHTCPGCGQPFTNNGWTGWTPLNNGQYGERTWQCPTCRQDMRPIESRPQQFDPRSSPLEELMGFLKQADNYQQDTRSWPDPTEPRAATPPEPKGCTCQQGAKLDCPIHGLNGDDSMDHTWSLPEGQPIGYQQDGPRNWTQAISSRNRWSVVSVHDLVSTHDTKHVPGRLLQHDHDLAFHPKGSYSKTDYRDHDESSALPIQSSHDRYSHGNRRDHRARRWALVEPAVVVEHRNSQAVVSTADHIDMEDRFLAFSPLQHMRPIQQTSQDDAHRIGGGSKYRRGIFSHRSPPSQEIPPVGIQVDKPYRHTSQQTHQIETQPDRPGHQYQAQRHTEPTDSVVQPKRSHTWSVSANLSKQAKPGIKIKPYRPGKYGKGVATEDGEVILIWRVKGGWNGKPHHDAVQEALALPHSMVAMHIDQDGIFYFHEHDEGFKRPDDPSALAKAVEARFDDLHWGHQSVERYEAAHNLTG